MRNTDPTGHGVDLGDPYYNAEMRSKRASETVDWDALPSGDDGGNEGGGSIVDHVHIADICSATGQPGGQASAGNVELRFDTWRNQVDNGLTITIDNAEYFLFPPAKRAAMLGWALGGTLFGRNRGQASADVLTIVGGNLQNAALFGTIAPVGVGPAPDFFVTPDGVVLPAPEGATGPELTKNGLGLRWKGGAGGPGLDHRVTGIRLMDPTDRYPSGYASYSNATDQAVNPISGTTLEPSDPWWHIPLIGFGMPR